MVQDKKPFGPEGYDRDVGDLPVDLDAVARAEAVVAAFSVEYLGWLGEDLNKVEALLDEVAESPAAVEKVRRKAHDIRGQGGSFGFPLITQAADSLHQLFGDGSDIPTDQRISLAREVLSIMRNIVEKSARGGDDAALRDSLTAISVRIEAAKPGA